MKTETRQLTEWQHLERIEDHLCRLEDMWEKVKASIDPRRQALTNTAPPAEVWLSPEQAAQRLGIHPVTARRLCRSGDLPGRKVGKRSWRIPASALTMAAN